MSGLILPDGATRHAVRVAETEALLLSMLAREPAPRGAFKSETEYMAWLGERCSLAASIFLLGLEHDPELVTIMPLGSVLPFRVHAATKRRGPEAAIGLTQELLETLRAEDPKDRDLLFLVAIDNRLLRQSTTPIITPGG